MKRLRLFGMLGGVVLVAAALFVALGPSQVPAEAIQSAVVRTPELIDRAWHLPIAATFAAEGSWQSNASRCGPASLANVFRSLGQSETTEAAVLDGTGKCWSGYCVVGLTLDELAELARAHTPRKVSVLRDLSPEAFREQLRLSNDLARRYIVNFSRESIFGGGAGHHSPVAGYLEAEDLVFVLDVNEDYRPWLIERERLFAAMNTLDGEKKRGLLLIE